MGGAQTFGSKHHCVFMWKRPRTSTDAEVSLLGSNCRFVQWEYEDAKSGGGKKAITEMVRIVVSLSDIHGSRCPG